MQKNISDSPQGCVRIGAGRLLVENLQKFNEIDNEITRKQGQVQALQTEILQATEQKTQTIRKVRHEIKHLQETRRRLTTICGNDIHNFLGLEG